MNDKKELSLSLVGERYIGRISPDQLVLTLAEGQLLYDLCQGIKRDIPVSGAPFIYFLFERIPKGRIEEVAQLLEKLGIFDEFTLSPDILEQIAAIKMFAASEKVEDLSMDETLRMRASTKVRDENSFREDAMKLFRDRNYVVLTRSFFDKLEKLADLLVHEKEKAIAVGPNFFKPKAALLSEKYPAIHELFNAVLPEGLKEKIQWCVKYQKNGDPYAMTTCHYAMVKNAEIDLRKVQQYIPSARLSKRKVKIEILKITQLVRDPKNKNRLVSAALAAVDKSKKGEEAIAPVSDAPQLDRETQGVEARLARLIRERDLLLRLRAMPNGQVHAERLNGVCEQIRVLQESAGLVDDIAATPGSLLSFSSMDPTLFGRRSQDNGHVGPQAALPEEPEFKSAKI